MTSRCDAEAPDTPHDIEETRRLLLRKMQDVLRVYRTCAAPVCRRARRCAHPALPCLREQAPAPFDQAAAMASLKRAFEQRLAELDADSGKSECPG